VFRAAVAQTAPANAGSCSHGCSQPAAHAAHAVYRSLDPLDLILVRSLSVADEIITDEEAIKRAFTGRRLAVGAGALGQCGAEQYQQLLELAQVGAACLGRDQ